MINAYWSRFYDRCAWSGLVPLIVDEDDVEDLFGAGRPKDDLLQPVLGEGPHPRLDRLLLDLRDGRPLCDQRLDHIVEDHDLKDARPSFVPDLVAEIASDRPVDRHLAVPGE